MDWKSLLFQSRKSFPREGTKPSGGRVGVSKNSKNLEGDPPPPRLARLFLSRNSKCLARTKPGPWLTTSLSLTHRDWDKQPPSNFPPHTLPRTHFTHLFSSLVTTMPTRPFSLGRFHWSINRVPRSSPTENAFSAERLLDERRACKSRFLAIH